MGLARGGPRPELTGSSCEMVKDRNADSARPAAVRMAIRAGVSAAVSPWPEDLLRATLRDTCCDGLNAA
jgi:hypothetical protein